MSDSPPPKRQRISSPAATGSTPAVADTQHAPAPIAPRTPLDTIPPVPTPPSIAPAPVISPTSPASPSSPSNPRKRRLSRSPKLNTLPPGTSLPSESSTRELSASVPISTLLTGEPGKKRGRTNTPWTAAEEQRLKHMRDSGNSWGDIAKSFPNRTEGSVKKHWYKDMHYAEFAEDESAALRDAIKEYEANKWKAIGQKLGKPAKACEQYAKEHFKNL